MALHIIRTTDGETHCVKSDDVIARLRLEGVINPTYRVLDCELPAFLHEGHSDSDTFWRAMAGVGV